MGRMKHASLLSAAFLLFTACSESDDTLRITMPACRPPDIAQGILFIGETEFRPYQVQASAITDAAGRPALSIRLDDEGADELQRITADRIGETLPLRIDDEIIMSPRVLETISQGEILVSGDFETDELKALAVRLAPSCDQEAPSAD